MQNQEVSRKQHSTQNLQANPEHANAEQANAGQAIVDSRERQEIAGDMILHYFRRSYRIVHSAIYTVAYTVVYCTVLSILPYAAIFYVVQHFSIAYCVLLWYNILHCTMLVIDIVQFTLVYSRQDPLLCLIRRYSFFNFRTFAAFVRASVCSSFLQLSLPSDYEGIERVLFSTKSIINSRISTFWHVSRCYTYLLRVDFPYMFNSTCFYYCHKVRYPHFYPCRLTQQPQISSALALPRSIAPRTEELWGQLGGFLRHDLTSIVVPEIDH